jgi:hypothetical protein
MYVAVVTLILGQAAFFADLRLLPYAAVVWLAFHLFVLIYGLAFDPGGRSAKSFPAPPPR